MIEVNGWKVGGQKMGSKPRVYLAGTYNEHKYRETIKRIYSDLIECIDPFEYVDQNTPGGDIVENDLNLIDSCDTLIAYITRPTFGTIMEIMYAGNNDKHVYIINPEKTYFNDPWLTYHSIKIFDNINDCVTEALKNFRLSKNDEEQNRNRNRHKCERIIKRNYFEGEEMEEKKNMNMGEIANKGLTRDDSKTSTRLLDKQWSPMICRKYYVSSWPCYVGLITDCNLNDLDKVVHRTIDEAKEHGFLDGNIQSCRNFCGFLSDKIDEHYDNIKKGSVEGIGIAWYVDKCFISSLGKDFMVHKSCRDEFYSILNILPHI
jgi:nucleoside 2-deoxyribosyltransferase